MDHSFEWLSSYFCPDCRCMRASEQQNNQISTVEKVKAIQQSAVFPDGLRYYFIPLTKIIKEQIRIQLESIFVTWQSGKWQMVGTLGIFMTLFRLLIVDALLLKA